MMAEEALGWTSPAGRAEGPGRPGGPRPLVSPYLLVISLPQHCSGTLQVGWPVPQEQGFTTCISKPQVSQTNTSPLLISLQFAIADPPRLFQSMGFGLSVTWCIGAQLSSPCFPALLCSMPFGGAAGACRAGAPIAQTCSGDFQYTQHKTCLSIFPPHMERWSAQRMMCRRCVPFAFFTARRKLLNVIS